ncbi:MAG: hypothetical protein H7Z19_11935, partial [Chitinophagaceae bacterium]|nr:hypothetical protein [Rubrivivax sp.]
MKLMRVLGPLGPRIGVLTHAGVHDLSDISVEAGMAWLLPAFSDLRLFLAAGAGLRE